MTASVLASLLFLTPTRLPSLLGSPLRPPNRRCCPRPPRLTTTPSAPSPASSSSRCAPTRPCSTAARLDASRPRRTGCCARGRGGGGEARPKRPAAAVALQTPRCRRDHPSPPATLSRAHYPLPPCASPASTSCSSARAGACARPRCCGWRPRAGAVAVLAASGGGRWERPLSMVVMVQQQGSWRLKATVEEDEAGRCRAVRRQRARRGAGGEKRSEDKTAARSLSPPSLSLSPSPPSEAIGLAALSQASSV